MPTVAASLVRAGYARGGDHYKKLGRLSAVGSLAPLADAGEFRGYMKGTAIAYLARNATQGAC